MTADERTADPTAPTAGAQRWSDGRAVSPGRDTLDEAGAARIAARARSLPQLFADRVAASGDDEAFRYRSGAGWTSVSWRETDHRVRRLAAGLVGAGVGRGDRVALVCATRYEWIVADLAIMSAGAACTTVFPTTSAEDTAFILADSGSRLVVVEDAAGLAKLESVRDQVPAVEAVVVVAGLPAGHDGAGGWARGLAELEDAGAGLLAADPSVVSRLVESLGPEDLACLVYTSGTTGRPKGARLVHDNWTYQGAAIAERELLHPDDLQFLWLPLSHVYGNVLISAQLAVGFVTAVDGRVDRLVENLEAQHPTFVAAAPRIFEKAHGRIVAAATDSPVKRRLFTGAFEVAGRVAQLRRDGRRVPVGLRARLAVADRLVFAKIRARFGGRLRFFISGSARLDPDLGRWFDLAGIRVLEGYGLTETSGPMFVNMPWDNRYGRVGPVFPGSEVAIADDGEVLLRGPALMRGYWGEPDGTGLRPDGWLATGDIGVLADGSLAVTDRKKDLIKTSNGKYVAPQKVENLLTSASELVGAALVVGDGRKYCAALLALDPEVLADWAGAHGLGELDYASLAGHEQVRKAVQDVVDGVNGRLSSWETLKRVELLPEPPSEDNGLLTATQKVRRARVVERYPELVDALYR